METNYFDKFQLKRLSSDYAIPDDKDTITDGWGNIYELPTDGYTPYFDIDDYFKVRYNWNEHTLELYTIEDLNEYIDSYGLNPYDFMDNPEYWINKLIDEHEQEMANYDAVKEAYELYGEIIDDDKEKYEYEIKLQYSLIPNNDDDWDSISAFEKDYENYLKDKNYTFTLYDNQVNVKYFLDSFNGELNIIIESPFVLTKEELLEIYDENEKTIEHRNKDYSVDVEEILSILEK